MPLRVALIGLVTTSLSVDVGPVMASIGRTRMDIHTYEFIFKTVFLFRPLAVFIFFLWFFAIFCFFPVHFLFLLRPLFVLHDLLE